MTAHAQVALGPRDVHSLFFITRSNNRNEVHYGVRLREGCVPASDSPIFAYWRLREETPEQLSPLLEREEAAYGIAPAQHVLTRRGLTRVSFQLNAFPDRPLVATIKPTGRTCSANVVAQVADRAAILDHIHIELGFLWSIQRIVLEATDVTGQAKLQEVIEP
jgi:hypothetical protein